MFILTIGLFQKNPTFIIKMVEKKLVVDELRLHYDGVFDILEFYKFVEDWMDNNGYQKELKKKAEYVEANGKKLEWFLEIWKMPSDWAKELVRMRAIFSNVKEVELKKGRHTRKMNQGSVLIIFDGFLETDLKARWQQKPLYYFLRAVYDKFVWRIWTNKYLDEVRNGCYNLHKELQGFFNLYKY